MKTLLKFSILAVLAIATPCFALMEIADVSREQAKELGMEIKANAAGPDAVRVTLEFKAEGQLKNYSRVELSMRDGTKSLVSATLREDEPKSGRVVVSFAADRTNLDKIYFRVVVEQSERSRVGYDIKVKDFVELDKVR
jgi:hypothetical protein